MANDAFMELIRNMLMITTELSLPSLGAALIVGVLIGFIQAITSIQEQTLSFIPKLFAIVGVCIFLGPWMMRLVITYTIDLFSSLPQYGAL